MRLPGGPGVRVDSGVTTGDVVSGAFDSLLAKLIITGSSREDALERARRALSEFEVAGLPTVLPFHRAIVEEPDFIAVHAKDFAVHTTWIESDFTNQIPPWSGSIQDRDLEEDLYRTVVVEVEGRRLKVGVPSSIFAGQSSAHRRLKAPKRMLKNRESDSSTSNSIVSPMQATVVKVLVSEGDVVIKGDLLVVLEAMKMEQSIVAPADGTVLMVDITQGESVGSGKLLVSLAP
jgi:acetyl-CoA/propionyl-CoA carboxylase biotin carboxyl carrier protein